MSEEMKLAQAIEALTEPSREIDGLIWRRSVNPTGFVFPDEQAGSRMFPSHVAPYTAFIDEAMLLVPKSWTEIEQHRHRMKDGAERSYVKIEFELRDMLLSSEGRAATPALALCAASIRALESTTDTGEES